jgi:hypothetical protein
VVTARISSAQGASPEKTLDPMSVADSLTYANLISDIPQPAHVVSQ